MTILILLGILIGFISGFFGIGGGMVLPGTAVNSSDSATTATGKSWIRSIVGLLSYQRTVTKVMADPKNCFYSIRNYEKTKLLIDEMHKKHSSSSLLSDLKDSLTQSKAE